MLMAVGIHLAIEVSGVTGLLVPGYTDGLALPISVKYTLEELELLQQRLLALGIPTKLSYLQRRGTRLSQALVIPNEHLPAVRSLLEPYILSDFLYLFDPATADNSIRP